MRAAERGLAAPASAASSPVPLAPRSPFALPLPPQLAGGDHAFLLELDGGVRRVGVVLSISGV